MNDIFHVCSLCSKVFPTAPADHQCPDGILADRTPYIYQVDPELVRAERAKLGAAIRSMMKIEKATSEATSSRKSWLRRVFKS